MLGYSLKISELKGEISRNLLAEARDQSNGSGDAAQKLREALQGDRISYYDSVAPWWSVGKLLNAIENERAEGMLVHNGGGYPDLFTARGRTIIEEIANVDGSRHEELRDILDPERFYFLEAWDQS